MSNKLVIGENINNWIVLENLGVIGRTVKYRVRCVCGKESKKKAQQIRTNKECYECSRKRQTLNGGPRRTHGACSINNNLYKTYMARHYMIKRCQGKTEKDHKNYVDRNIMVCKRWLDSFENFLEDMGKRPENSSLDRIDNSKGYFKENCRWTSTKVQNDNKRGCIYYEYNGEKLTIARWAERFGITRSKAAEWIKKHGIIWVVNNLDKIKLCRTGMSNNEYILLGFGKRKGHGQRKHSASRDLNHPLHKMYKSWDYMKHKSPGMCERWSDFSRFVEDMGQKPDGKRLLRKLTNERFDKENCYWG